MAIDKMKLIQALDEVNPGKVHFVDRNTGQVLLVTLEDKPGFEKMKKMLAADPGRYTQVPKNDTQQNLTELEGFIAVVHDPKLKELLKRAMVAHKPFREFQDILSTKVKEKREWDAFHKKNLEDRAERFIKSSGLK